MRGNLTQNDRLGSSPQHNISHAKVPLTSEGSASSSFFIIYPSAFLSVASGWEAAAGRRCLCPAAGRVSVGSVPTGDKAQVDLIRRYVQSVSVTLSTRALAFSLAVLLCQLTRGSSELPEVEHFKIK